MPPYQYSRVANAVPEATDKRSRLQVVTPYIKNGTLGRVGCSRHRGGFCVFGRLEQGRRIFYALNSLHGLGKEVARMQAPTGAVPHFTGWDTYCR
jgi:hypothetical protein